MLIRPVNSLATPTRRRFLQESAGSLLSVCALAQLAAPALQSQAAKRNGPWHTWAFRWGQTNLNEMDPKRYDANWWRKQWRRTHVQGLVVNAGGIVAYYPSKFPLHYRAKYLGDRDLYGEITRLAHEDGIAVLARMDSNRTTEDFYKAHPDWFAVRADGKPYRADERYVTCIDSPYYEEYLPSVLREIIEWEKPEGFTDNSWSGLGRNQICYCDYSRKAFRANTGHDLPQRRDWDDTAYREWIKWSYARRVEIWELNNRTTKNAGGPDCLWLGMIGGDFISQGARFRDIKAICERAGAIMLDDQGRSVDLGFFENAEMGKRLHGLIGWDKIIPESMATYQRSPTFRKAAATKAESRMWMYSGFAGSINPWWHHVGAYQPDRRQFQTPIPVYDWYEKNEQYLTKRRPVATIGVVYSQDNADFFGRDHADELVSQPYYGMLQALVRARIPYLPVHADHIGRDAAGLKLLILPNMAAMSDAQVAAVKRYAADGGNIVATGEASLYNEWGDKRGDFALAAELGIQYTGRRQGSSGEAESWTGNDHTYLRLVPDVGQDVDGPLSGEEPAISGNRHPVLKGFEQTDIVAFGGLLLEVGMADGAEAPLTYVPDFPAYPPETSFMRTPRTNIPALVVRTRPDGGRSAYFAADLDRRYAHDYFPDHANLLANTVRWAAQDDIPLRVDGTGLIDCHLYRQENRVILHLVNQTSAGTWRSPVDELIPVGPFTVNVKLPGGTAGRGAHLLVAERSEPVARQGDWATFEVGRLVDHEVVVVE